MSVVFKGNWFMVEQEPLYLSDGKVITAEYVTRTDGVRIIARRDDGAVLITNEHRFELGARDFRLPGGKVESLTPLDAAKCELREETGFIASAWRSICSTQAFSMVRYSLHFFEARELKYDPIDHDEGEDIEVCWFSIEQAAAMALDGTVGEDLSALQILRMAREEGVL